MNEKEIILEAMSASLFAKSNRLWSNRMTDTKTMRFDEVPRLEDQFCFPLYACAKEVVRQYRKPLEALNLTYTQYLVMMVLRELLNHLLVSMERNA